MLLLGVGNVLFGDDGFGPEALTHFTDNYELPEDVHAMDVGTGVRKVLFALSLSEQVPEQIFILDAVDGGAGDGKIGEVPLESLSSGESGGFSLHHAPSGNLLRELRDRRGVKVHIVACDVGAVPEVVQPGLSPAVRQGVVTAARHLAERLGVRSRHSS